VWIVLVIGALVVARELVRAVVGPSPGLADCPADPPTAQVGSYRLEAHQPAGPTLAPSPVVPYVLHVEFEVTNPTTVPIDVSSVLVDVVGKPGVQAVAHGGSSGSVGPGETVTLKGSASFVEEVGDPAGLPTMPDPATVSMFASWADSDYLHCDI